MNILLVRPDGIGDEILSLPVATALRRLMPGARLSFLSSAYAAPVLAHHPDLDEVLTVTGQERLGELVRLFKQNVYSAIFLKPFRRLMTAAWLARVPLRVHMDIVVTHQMLIEPADVVVLLPAATRYETPGGVTETSTERRIIFSPEVRGRRIGEARPEWEAFSELARRVLPDLADAITWDGTPSIRAEIAAVDRAGDLLIRERAAVLRGERRQVDRLPHQARRHRAVAPALAPVAPGAPGLGEGLAPRCLARPLRARQRPGQHREEDRSCRPPHSQRRGATPAPSYRYRITCQISSSARNGSQAGMAEFQGADSRGRPAPPFAIRQNR